MFNARIDPLRAIAEPEIATALQAGDALDLGPTDGFG
jgi:hypothetical protein